VEVKIVIGEEVMEEAMMEGEEMEEVLEMVLVAGEI